MVKRYKDVCNLVVTTESKNDNVPLNVSLKSPQMANLFSATTTTTTTRGTMNNTLTKPHILLLSRNSPKIPSFVSSSRIPFPILFSAPKTRSSLRPSAGSAPPPPPRRQPDPPPQKGLLRFEVFRALDVENRDDELRGQYPVMKDYEGAVDIDKISDPVLQRATQDQIAYFGQTPSQLLTVPHMKRMPLADVLHLQTIFRNPKEVKQYNVPSPERCNLPASAIHPSSDTVVIVDVNVPAAHVAQHKWQPNTPDGQGAPFLFQHGKGTTSMSGGGTLMRMFKSPSGSGEEWQFPQAQAFAASGIRSSAVTAITCDKEIITGGHVDNSIKLVSSDGAKTLETAIGHCAPVSCVALSPDSNYLVTGSKDTTVLLWRIHQTYNNHSSSIREPSASTGTQNSTSSNTTNILSDKNRKHRIEGPLYVLRGHRGEITSCAVNSDLGIIVSCSHSSDVLLHSIRGGRLIRRLDRVDAQAVCLSSEGIIITWNKSLHTLSTFTLNGILISSARLPFSGSVGCMEVSTDGMSVVIGININSENDSAWYENPEVENLNSESNDSKGLAMLDVPVPSVCFLDLHTLKVFHTLKLREGQDITALALNKDNTNLLVSTVDKQLMVFTDPALSLKVVDHMLKIGWEGDGLSPLIK